MCGGGWRRWRGHDQAQRPFLHPGCGRVVIRIIVLGEVDDVDARHSRGEGGARKCGKKRKRDDAFQRAAKTFQRAAKNLGTPELSPPISSQKGFCD